MANYYVDFSSGVNGTGTAASPWNVFTSTQSASVSAGDSVWFRRYIMAIDTKFIAWKSGTAANNRINYIGWPIAGDEYYDIREETLRAAWDADITQYAYQRRSAYIANTPAASLVSYINVHRFYIWDDFGSNTNIRAAIGIKDATYVTLKNCYGYMSYLPPDTDSTDWWGGSLYCENTAGIEIINSTIDGSGIMSLSRNTTLKIKTSTVTFSGCTFNYGWPAGGAPVVAYLVNSASSYIGNSTVTFNTCTFNFKQTSGNIASIYSDTVFYAHMHFVNSNTTISGCTIAVNGTGSGALVTTNMMPANIPLTIMRFSGGTVNIQNTATSTIMNKFTMFDLMDNTAATLNNVSWTIGTTVYSNIFICIRSAIASLSLSNITGSSSTVGLGDLTNENFMFAFVGWDKVAETVNITMSNVAPNLGYVLDATRPNSATIYQNVFIKNNSCPILSYNTLYITSVGYLNARQSNMGGFKLFQKTYVFSDFIQGSSQVFVKLLTDNCSFSKVPIQIQATNTQVIYATLASCIGAGTDILQANGNTVYSLFLVASRNRGFSGIGTVADLPWLNTKAILNDFNNGTAQYISYDINYETTTASRAGGAGYAVKVIKKIDDNIRVVYPTVGEDATWVYFPSAATYTVTGYVYYTAASGSLTSADIQLGIDIMGAYSYENISSVVSSDDSTWTGVSGGTTIKLTSSIAIPKEQYAPVKLYLNKRLVAMVVYFDPKLTVVKS